MDVREQRPGYPSESQPQVIPSKSEAAELYRDQSEIRPTKTQRCGGYSDGEKGHQEQRQRFKRQLDSHNVNYGTESIEFVEKNH